MKSREVISLSNHCPSSWKGFCHRLRSESIGTLEFWRSEAFTAGIASSSSASPSLWSPSSESPSTCASFCLFIAAMDGKIDMAGQNWTCSVYDFALSQRGAVHIVRNFASQFLVEAGACARPPFLLESAKCFIKCAHSIRQFLLRALSPYPLEKSCIRAR